MNRTTDDLPKLVNWEMVSLLGLKILKYSPESDYYYLDRDGSRYVYGTVADRSSLRYIATVPLRLIKEEKNAKNINNNLGNSSTLIDGP